MNWYEAVSLLTPHVVRINTPTSSGTGYLLLNSRNGALCAIATAAHVVDHAHYWEQLLRITGAASGNTKLLRPSDRAILTDSAKDTAVILFDPKDLGLPADPIPLIEEGKVLRVGVSIGWLGFPAIPSADLCFFTGTVSALLETHNAYFVDGVAINGVSGGPAFFAAGDQPIMIGVVSAYMPNRATGETLPGLGIVRDVSHFHQVVRDLRSMDEAKAEEEKTAPAEPPPTVSPAGAIPNSSRRAT
jgi:hypothetical protein